MFDSGGYGDAAILNLQVLQKSPIVKNPLLFNYPDKDYGLVDIYQEPFKTDWFGGINASWKQTYMTNTIPNDDMTKRIYSSVSKQLQIINSHFQRSMFKYKYPRVTRSNILLESSNPLRPATQLSLAMKAIRFQPTPQRELPCYGNLELPLKIKQERDSPVYKPMRSIREAEPVQVKTESEVKTEREKEKEKDRYVSLIFYFTCTTAPNILLVLKSISKETV